MAEVPLQTLEELDLTAEEFEALVEQGLTLTMVQAMSSEEIAEALAEGDVTALDVLLTLWAAYVTRELIPSLNLSMGAAALITLQRLSNAVDNPLLQLIDQPLDTELYLQQAANRLVAIGNDLWSNARTALAEGLALGESQPKLAQRVRDAVGVTLPRAKTIARTESHGARNVAAQASFQRFEAAFAPGPGVMRKQWQATEDDRTRHTHHEADGQTVSFSEPFEVGGFSLAFPGDPAGPAQEVINCRCTTFAVFDPADLNLGDSETVMTLNAAAYQEEDTMAEEEGSTRWWPLSGEIVVGNRVTGDRREFDTDNLEWQKVGVTAGSLEIPLGYQYERSHGGMGSDKVALVGRLDSVDRQDGKLFARGVVDLKTAWGRRAAIRMGTREEPGTLAGVSIIIDEDPDGDHYEVEYQFAEGCELDNEEAAFDPACSEPERTIVKNGARVRAVDLVDIPAFAEARLYLDKPLPADIEEPAEDEDDVLIASAYTITIPELPPVEWFNEPAEVPEIGAITVTEDGRFFGYLAPRHVAHRSIRNKRVTVPTGNVDYGMWMNRATLADDGRGGFTKVATGPITMDCGHAPSSNRVVGAARREHYDNTCSVVATARVGENSRGVWIAGALIPGVNAAQVAKMMACQLSGDWGPHREKPGKRELSAALLVPVPGFPTPHHSFTMRGGEILTTNTPIRFSTYAEVPEPVGMRAAADLMAAELGRDKKSRLDAFALSLHNKGE